MSLWGYCRISCLPRKDENGKWNIKGHLDRVVFVNDETLQEFALLYDEPDTRSRAARLPALYTRKFFSPIIECLAQAESKMQDLK